MPSRPVGRGRRAAFCGRCSQAGVSGAALPLSQKAPISAAGRVGAAHRTLRQREAVRHRQQRLRLHQARQGAHRADEALRDHGLNEGRNYTKWSLRYSPIEESYRIVSKTENYCRFAKGQNEVSRNERKRMHLSKWMFASAQKKTT